MTGGVSNPRLPMCLACGDEKHPECLDSEGRCGWCADIDEARDLAAKRAEALADFRYFSRLWFRDQRYAAEAVIDAAERARELLGERFHAETLLDGTEPVTSSEYDYREAEAS